MEPQILRSRPNIQQTSQQDADVQVAESPSHYPELVLVIPVRIQDRTEGSKGQTGKPRSGNGGMCISPSDV